MRTLRYGGGTCVWANVNGLLISRLTGLITTGAQQYFAQQIGFECRFLVAVCDPSRATVLSEDAIPPSVPLHVAVAHVLSARQLMHYSQITQRRIKAGGLTRNFTDDEQAFEWAQRRLADAAPRWAHEALPTP